MRTGLGRAAQLEAVIRQEPTIMNSLSDAESYFREVLLPPVQALVADLHPSAEEMKPEIHRLLILMPQYDHVVEFGSGTGWRAIALAVGLRAREVVGIDSDEDAVEQANRQIGSGFLGKVLSEVSKLTDIYEKPAVRNELTPETRSVVDGILSRFRPRPTFRCLHGDLTIGRPIEGLPSNHFDLAHSRYCLYQIYCGDPLSPSDVDNAIAEMIRVVKPGGVLAAHEPGRCADSERSPFDMAGFLQRRMELSLVHCSVVDGSPIVIARKE